MQTPQLISRTKQIETEISTIRTSIFALEMGHDYLDSRDKAQLKAWNDQLEQLYSEMEAIKEPAVLS